MSLNHFKKEDFSDLRRKAEEMLVPVGRKQPKDVSSREVEHELNVHKVELEMQNEELLAAQAKLIKSVQEYSDLFEYAPVGYFILDKLGVILKANTTGIDQLGLDNKWYPGNHFSVYLNSIADQDHYYLHRNLVIESEKKHELECEIKRQDGSTFFALIESMIIKDDKNKFKHLLTTVTDISEQKEHEKRLEISLHKEKNLNEMKTQFINVVSHEFRTPLTTILSSVELMEKYYNSGDIDKRKKHLVNITAAVHQLKGILIDFLSSEEVEEGKTKNNPAPFNLPEFIYGVIEEAKLLKGIHSITYTNKGRYDNVNLDENLLRVCIFNLLTNAHKFSPKGSSIEITTEQNTLGKVIISVTDKGIGIPQNDKLLIFEPFFRAKNAEVIQGTGLGLNITKELVTLMGGGIYFESKENEGSTFMLKFPND